MVTLISLWLPILIASVLVYITGIVLYMVLPFHSKHFAKLPDEDAVIDALRTQDVKLGQYMFPGAESREECTTPEWIEKTNQGPVGFLFVMPPGTSMSRHFIFHALFIFAISVMAGYMGSASLSPGAEYLEVFQVVGAATFLGHSFGHFPNAIWHGFSWKLTWIRVFEGLLYALLTAGIFAWLWPQ